jgi:hypothetical protein
MLYAFPTTNQPMTAYINQERKKQISENHRKKETSRRGKKRIRKKKSIAPTHIFLPFTMGFLDYQKEPTKSIKVTD